MRASLAHFFSSIVPGTLLLLALVFAPWYWACTWPQGIFFLNILLLTAGASWGGGLLLRGRRPELSWVLFSVVVLLLAQGWGMTENAHTFANEDTGLLIPTDETIPWLPGSIDLNASRASMVRISALLAAALVTAHLGRHLFWRRALGQVMAWTGLSLALLGVVQRLTHAPDIFWAQGRHLELFFGTFVNVTHAGAYLNFCLPLTATFALGTLIKKRGSAAGSIAFSGSILLLAATLIVGSKIAPLLALLLLLFFLILQFRFWKPLLQETRFSVLALYGLILIVAAGALAGSFGFSFLESRFAPSLQDENNYSTVLVRLHVYRIAARGLPDAGWLGLGPGTFATAFPYYNYAEGAQAVSGRWLANHEDYLQTYLEWGPCGAALWSLYLFGAIYLLARGRRGGADRWRTEDRLLAGGLITALTGLTLLSLGDFPLQMATQQFYAAVAIGLGWSSPFWPRRVVRPARSDSMES